MLTIPNITSREHGTYVCIIENEINRTELYGFFTVLYGPQNMQLYPTESKVKEGDMLTLSCMGESNPSPIISWKKLGSDHQDNWNISTSNGQSVLSIPNITSRESGTYVCIIENEINRTELNGLVTVLYGPQNMHLDPTDSKVKEGDMLTLSCMGESNPSPIISWKKLGSDHQDNWNISTSNGQSVLSILNITSRERGTYICIIENEINRTELYGLVTVLYGPQNMHLDPTESKVKEGDMLTLSCMGESNPSPIISWKKLGSDHQENWNISSSNGQSVLSILNITSRESGTYICIIENEINRTELYGLVTVLYGPQNMQLYPTESKVKEGDMLTLSCMGESNPSPVISWRKLGSDHQDNWNISTANGQSVLSIPNITSRESGTYICIIENEINRTELYGLVTVLCK
ncbi:neuronal growth regulator 1-like [Protopterus annectens]|uniref:neuronal growth regulator 1-like n=1 Tax=Protopterus annectens TaxID=7888 RepID=UPI001CF99035|nr:neuronal growth regulator 1-like [Protopterus annectens]